MYEMLRTQDNHSLRSVPRYGYLRKTSFVQAMISCFLAGAEHGRYWRGGSQVASLAGRVRAVTLNPHFARFDCHFPYPDPELVR
jgi:hypothetical protein